MALQRSRTTSDQGSWSQLISNASHNCRSQLSSRRCFSSLRSVFTAFPFFNLSQYIGQKDLIYTVRKQPSVLLANYMALGINFPSLITPVSLGSPKLTLLIWSSQPQRSQPPRIAVFSRGTHRHSQDGKDLFISLFYKNCN